jgi:hypothetical protein
LVLCDLLLVRCRWAMKSEGITGSSATHQGPIANE